MEELTDKHFVQKDQSEALQEEINHYLFKGNNPTSSPAVSNIQLEKRTLAVSYAKFLCTDAASLTPHHLNLVREHLSVPEILSISEYVLGLIGKPKTLAKINRLLQK